MVHRTTEYAKLHARHGSPGQARFFLASRGEDAEAAAEADASVRATLDEVAHAIPADWRRARVERSDLDRFLFSPEDVIVVVGQDGLVANVAKYLSGQPVIGIDTEPGRNPGVLVRHRAPDAPKLLRAATLPHPTADELTMAEAVADDTQRLLALNEIYIGQPTHQTARYVLHPRGAEGPAEHQASSGLLVGTGTGATGWLRSVWQQTGAGGRLPSPTDGELVWFVREAWPSPATGTELVRGALAGGESLQLTVESDRLVAFGDGIESDALTLTMGQRVRLGRAGTALRLLV
nr:NAD(+)/NADH kinase [Streptomyces coryli]